MAAAAHEALVKSLEAKVARLHEELSLEEELKNMLSGQVVRSAVTAAKLCTLALHCLHPCSAAHPLP